MFRSITSLTEAGFFFSVPDGASEMWAERHTSENPLTQRQFWQILQPLTGLPSDCTQRFAFSMHTNFSLWVLGILFYCVSVCVSWGENSEPLITVVSQLGSKQLEDLLKHKPQSKVDLQSLTSVSARSHLFFRSAVYILLSCFSSQLIRIRIFSTSGTNGSFVLTFHGFQRERPSQPPSSGFTRISSRNTTRTRHSQSASTRFCKSLQTGLSVLFSIDLLDLAPWVTSVLWDI